MSRSKTTKRILEETPQSVKDSVKKYVTRIMKFKEPTVVKRIPVSKVEAIQKILDKK